jgi:hypothetical protein
LPDGAVAILTGHAYRSEQGKGDGTQPSSTGRDWFSQLDGCDEASIASGRQAAGGDPPDQDE